MGAGSLSSLFRRQEEANKNQHILLPKLLNLRSQIENWK